MKIIVCIKQVPDTDKVKLNKQTGTLIRDGVPSIINPEDVHSLEQALAIKDQFPNTQVTVLTMGPTPAHWALREALAMGADKGIHLSDRAFAGSDTYGTATILAAAVKKIGAFDLIFCGRQAIDGDTAQVGPELAELLSIPHIAYAKAISVKENGVEVERKTEDGYWRCNSGFPVLVTIIKELNVPRFCHAGRIFKVFDSEWVTTWTAEDLDVDLMCIGMHNSPTQVESTFVPQVQFHGTVLEGSARETAKQLIETMTDGHWI